MKPEYIRTSLKKLWLEDFYVYCDENVPKNLTIIAKLNLSWYSSRNVEI